MSRRGAGRVAEMAGRWFSPLTRRILTVNVLPLAILVGGILYLGEYRDSLVEAQQASLETQAQIFAGALGEGAIGTRPNGDQFILPDVSRPMLRRLVSPTQIRARLFAPDGSVIADSRFLNGQGGAVQVEELPPPGRTDFVTSLLYRVYDTLASILPSRDQGPPYPVGPHLTATAFSVATSALGGITGTARWLRPDGSVMLGAAAPVQRFKQVLGAVMVTASGEEIDSAVRSVRLDILKVFAVVLALTVLLSFYLAGTIARPVRRLAAAADIVRGGHGEADAIPDFSKRRDEIGDLSESLRDMTEALWQRMQANESFAADVAHEIKNPLTSLRSAVETAARVKDPEQQATLMAIIQDDVRRLDRLITDISDASRLDAELARGRTERIDLGRLLQALAQVHQKSGGNTAPRLTFRDNGTDCVVTGIEGRLVQVFQNLLSNAMSFTPPGSEIVLSVSHDGDEVVVRVEDQGPGIPPANLESIFERFYSERPEGESFGRHSGLGLSISRQIVEAHNGTIHAENVHRADGRRRGARFVVRLPAVTS